jgi:hypothetical protein
VKFQGWSLEGLKVFNRLCQDIEECKQTANSVQLESAILAHELQLSANLKGRGSVNKEQRATGAYVICYDGMLYVF